MIKKLAMFLYYIALLFFYVVGGGCFAFCFVFTVYQPLLSPFVKVAAAIFLAIWMLEYFGMLKRLSRLFNINPRR